MKRISAISTNYLRRRHNASVDRARSVLRLSCLFALLDRSGIVRKPHLEAALAVWRYAEDSACFIFGDRIGGPVADEIIKALREVGVEGMTRTAIRDLFARNRSASEITRALRILVEAGLAAFTLEESEGTNRKTERWRALSVADRNTQKGYDINDINDLKNQEEGEASFPDTHISPEYSEDDAYVVNVVNVVPSDIAKGDFSVSPGCSFATRRLTHCGRCEEFVL